MNILEVAKYLSTNYDSKRSIAIFLEELLNIKIQFDKFDQSDSTISLCVDRFGIPLIVRDSTDVVTSVWKHLNDNQKQILIDTIKKMQEQDNLKLQAPTSNKETTIINNHLTQNNTNTANSSAFATCQTMAELRNLIEKDNSLSEQTKKEFSELFEKLNKEPNKLDLVKLLSKLIRSNILAPFMNELVTIINTLL